MSYSESKRSTANEMSTTDNGTPTNKSFNN